MSSPDVLDALAVIGRQQDVARALVAGREVDPADLALLSAPLPRLVSGTPDPVVLRALHAAADALQEDLARRMATLEHAGRAAAAPSGGPRYLDARG